MLAPYVVVWESTKACDFACKHCRAKAIPNRLPNELNEEEVLSLIDDLSSLGVKIFVISGGDALKRDDIVEIIKYSSKRITTALSPSGSRIDINTAKKLKEAGVSIASISVDGPEEIHDEFRGVKGAFQIAMKAINSFKQIGIPVQINTTISKYNINHLEKVKETVLSLNPINWDIFVLIPTGRATREMMITPEENEMLMRKVYNWRHKEGINVRMTCNPYYIRVSNELGSKPLPPDTKYGRRSIEGARGCMAGNGYAFISYDGTVYPCGFLPLPAGNIRFKKFSEIYNESPIFNSLRNPNSLKGKCGICEYRTVCGGCRARSYSITKDYLAEDPFCLYTPKRVRIA